MGGGLDESTLSNSGAAATGDNSSLNSSGRPVSALSGDINPLVYQLPGSQQQQQMFQQVRNRLLFIRSHFLNICVFASFSRPAATTAAAPRPPLTPARLQQPPTQWCRPRRPPPWRRRPRPSRRPPPSSWRSSSRSSSSSSILRWRTGGPGRCRRHRLPRRYEMYVKLRLIFSLAHVQCTANIIFEAQPLSVCSGKRKQESHSFLFSLSLPFFFAAHPVFVRQRNPFIPNLEREVDDRRFPAREKKEKYET